MGDLGGSGRGSDFPTASEPTGISGRGPQAPGKGCLCPSPPLGKHCLLARLQSQVTLGRGGGSARVCSPRPLTYEDPPYQPLTVSYTLTFRMGKPRSRDSWQLAQDCSPELPDWLVFPSPHSSPQPLTPNSWAHPEKPSPVVATTPRLPMLSPCCPWGSLDPPKHWHPTKGPSSPSQRVPPRPGLACPLLHRPLGSQAIRFMNKMYSCGPSGLGLTGLWKGEKGTGAQ